MVPYFILSHLTFVGSLYLYNRVGLKTTLHKVLFGISMLHYCLVFLPFFTWASRKRKLKEQLVERVTLH